MPKRIHLAALLLSALLSGCTGAAIQPAPPPAPVPEVLPEVPPLPVPPELPPVVLQPEPLSATGNHPYTVFGKRYFPLASADNYVERGIASWYGKKFHGRRTSSGETYDMHKMTAAHPVLPLPSYVRVTHLANGKSVVVRVNDRGPFLHGRIIDLSYVAAKKLGLVAPGTGRVEVRVLAADDPEVLTMQALRGEVDAETVAAVMSGAPVRVLSRPRNSLPGSVRLQVGAYTVHRNARRMLLLLSRAGYETAAIVEVELSDGDVLYRVRVGPFADQGKAQLTRERLERLLGHSVGVVRE